MHLSLLALYTLWSYQGSGLAGLVLREDAIEVPDRELRPICVVEPYCRDALASLMEPLDRLHLALALVW